MALQHLAFPATVEFATQRWWHAPLEGDEVWVGARRNGRLIGSALLVFRTVTAGCGDLPVGGVGNVCSHPDSRGQGAAKACMRAAQEIIASAADFGMLMAGGKVRAFYEDLGWRVIDSEVVYRKVDGSEAVFHGPEPFILIYPGRRQLADWPEGPINLNGPDW